LRLTRLGSFALVLLLVAAGAVFYGYRDVIGYVNAPFGLSVEATVVVPKGATLATVVHVLEASGIVKRPRVLYIYARLTKRTQVRAGEYSVSPDETPASLLAKIGEGRVKTERFAIIEGHNRWQVRQALVDARWMSPAEFDRFCDDKGFLARHQIPGPTCEGYLFPETYTFARGLAAEAIFGAIFTMFKKMYAAATAQGTGPLKLEPRAFVTLASIVEKETGAPGERPHVACVFYNRLTAKPAWRLETDPTVIYAATLADPAFDGNLKRSHLHELESPYNTYRVFGLPPGPIANAGRASFDAVARPATCGDFFFVSNNSGEHIFCPTLGCHNQAVEKWQVEYFHKPAPKSAPSAKRRSHH
jgi:UPF0755 protein